ncbi:DedA family protein [Mucispirillum schaedleri]|uniref:DedA family protein n=1 Tax=Mucispirillum schaedleri TaxID=248039 RepID=UPI001F5728FD|nr:DedA family protein [Mucispirillum schaedleri]
METIKSLFHDILGIGAVVVTFLVHTVGRLGYAGVILLMALESSFVPFPSEVVVPPAGYLASLGQMNIFLVILSGIVGSILGSLLNYWIASRFGRDFLLKYSKYFFINTEKFARFEVFFNTHGEITTFVGRLIPVIRQYISFPAGLVRMNLKKFIFYTGLGAAIWCTVLAYVGYFVGNNIDIIKENIDYIMYFIFPALILLVIIYMIIYKYHKKRETIS